MRYYTCTTKNCNNKAVNPSIGLTLCEECGTNYKPPWERGFWGLPWGWVSVAFWVALWLTQRYLGDLSDLSMNELIFMGALCGVAVLALFLKVIKFSIQHR